MKTVTKEDIIYLFSQKFDIPLSFMDIKHGLSIASPGALPAAKKMLDSMVSSGELLLTKGEKYIYPQKLNLIRGTVFTKKRGYAFISDDTGGCRDIFVRDSDLGGAIPNDVVIIQLIPDSSRYLKEKNRKRVKTNGKPKLSAKSQNGSAGRRGRVVRIVKRNLKSFKAVVKVEKNIAILTPVSPEFYDIFYFDMHRFKYKDMLKNGVIVNAILPKTGDLSSRAVLIDKVLGGIESQGTEEEIILNKYDIYKSFDEKVMEELSEIPEDLEEEETVGGKSGNRRDLTRLPFITIDGEDAKDFDDAVCVETSTKAGLVKLYVAIADVSYFVGYGGYIDKEAFKRGNSTYFPGHVYPMLPEGLSNDLCSLLPKKKRFVMVCEMDVDIVSGKIERKKIYRGAIKTFGRLTYNEVYNYLTMSEDRTESENEGDSGLFHELDKKLFPIKDMLLKMRILAEILRKKRIKNGSLYFDPIKSKVELNENNEVLNVIPEPRNFAHDLIEDFMITANCAVAEFIEAKKVSSIYRVHERPDEEKVKEFLKILKYFKLPFVYGPLENSLDYQEMLDKLKENPLSSFLEQAFLRSMRIAVYSPVNIHHFGLALTSYTHFTSPIRRYADLLIHRILAFMLYGDDGNKKTFKAESGGYGDAGKGKNVPEWLNLDYLRVVSNIISRREKLSSDAEREYSDFKKMQFLKKNEQAVYDGFITNVVNFGFFVDIKGFFIQGFVHVSTIADDYYEYNDNTKILKGKHGRKIFKIGDKVEVSVYSIDLLKREVDLRFIEFDKHKKYKTGFLSARKRK
ncbi:ribonuclease R family protein [Candidatus Acidulodesulfobacterium sp. H_13]|uniref:ribonuclease R family protein n=1 Tax=Candidatus Acidulodesulfobacterium sp. H_13 TaxID=3395470 RepID=UPI003AF53D43